MQAEPPGRTLRLRLDRSALSHNWQALDRLSGAANAGAAVKADAYGLGVNAVVPLLRDTGAHTFFVAHWSEVADVLRYTPPETISVLHGPLTGNDCAYARATGVRPVINSVYQARLWRETGGGLCDLMVDTGINRLGIGMSELGDHEVSGLEIDILMSHLASADEDSQLNGKQLARFTQACSSIPARRRSLASSAGIALGKEYAFDVTRPGLSLYGGIPRPELKREIRQVAQIEAALIQCRNISPGDSVGYNAKFTATEAMRVGVVSLGYADGFLRSWNTGGILRKDGALLPLLGRISMDMAVVDLAAVPHLREGDWVEVPYYLPDAAQTTGLSQYELLTILGHRFQRL
ncbi:alanine racemase [Croceicoccus estronivorus]|uniref:alanine racemase n=1 Tax=Croceicoccus estronivorus TaxID=1172626 RepID=UPI00082EDFA9|nr:alanine racemase [Croceicoccus estronivorus]OCC24540.1 alanine racemase [Croceicoccus estronivorus]